MQSVVCLKQHAGHGNHGGVYMCNDSPGEAILFSVGYLKCKTLPGSVILKFNS